MVPPPLFAAPVQSTQKSQGGESLSLLLPEFAVPGVVGTGSGFTPVLPGMTGLVGGGSVIEVGLVVVTGPGQVAGGRSTTMMVVVVYSGGG